MLLGWFCSAFVVKKCRDERRMPARACVKILTLSSGADKNQNIIKPMSKSILANIKSKFKLKVTHYLLYNYDLKIVSEIKTLVYYYVYYYFSIHNNISVYFSINC